MKQIALGALMYAQDNDEVYVGWRQGAEACGAVRGGWPEHVISPYVKNHDLFKCPSGRFNGRTSCGGWSPYANNMALNSSYGWNCVGLGNGTWVFGTKMALILRPAELFWLADGGNPWRPWLRDPVGCGAGYTSDATEPHNGGRNIGYCDGHAKWMASKKAYARDTGIMANYLPWANRETYPPGW